MRSLSLAVVAAVSLLASVFAAGGPIQTDQVPLSGPRTPARDAPSRPASGTATIAGTVIADAAGAPPVRRARVQLRSQQDNAGRVSVTDDEGRFVFQALPAGRYTMTVTKPGYVTLPYGAESHRGLPLPIALEEGQAATGLVARLTRGSVITGRILDSNGLPFAGAILTLGEQRMINGAPTVVRALTLGLTRTDDRGMFRLYGLPAGSYVLGASPFLGGSAGGTLTSDADVRWATGPRNTSPAPRRTAVGYAAVYYPGTTDSADASVIELGAGEERGGIDLTLPLVPTSTVTGHVSRSDGLPVSTVQVTAIRETASAALAFPFASLLPVRSQIGPDGKFTISGLQPGTYAIMARAPSVAPARGRGAAGFGTSWPPGVPPPPPPPPPAPGRGGSTPAQIFDLWAEVTLTAAGEDVDGLTLVLQPGMTVSGQIRFEATSRTPPSDLSQVSVRLMPPPSATGISMGVPPIQANADGSFSFRGVGPGSYVLTANGPGMNAVGRAGGPAPEWILRSAVTGGRDILDLPMDVRPQQDVSDLVVTFTDRVTELSGSLVDGAGRPAPEYYVIVFGTDARHWRQGSRWLRPPTRPGTDGRFRMTGLPAGDYYLAALPEFDQNEWHTPGFLEQVVPGAIPITLAEGEHRTQDIRLAGG